MQPIALVPRGLTIPATELAEVSSAIQIQLMRDFGPAWGVQASCVAYPSLVDVPSGYLPIFVVPDAKGKAGMHYPAAHPDEPPFAIVTYQTNLMWSCAASHEVIELLVDPTGARFVIGQSPIASGAMVSFLVEACDPCQDIAFAYQVDGQHAALVSDFCLPSYYGLGLSTAPFSFRGSVLAPFSVGIGGYLSWRDDAGEWFQLRSIAGPAQVFGPLSAADVLGDQPPPSYRGWLDRLVTGYAGPEIHRKRSRSVLRATSAVNRAAKERRDRRNRTIERYLNGLAL